MCQDLIANHEKLSSVLSLIAALIILVANFFQWWQIGYDGKMITKKWVKIMFGFCCILLAVALFLILNS